MIDQISNHFFLFFFLKKRLGDSSWLPVAKGEGTMTFTVTPYAYSKLNFWKMLAYNTNPLNSPYNIEGIIVKRGDEKKFEPWNYAQTFAFLFFVCEIFSSI